jgi:hypothetical protein
MCMLCLYLVLTSYKDKKEDTNSLCSSLTLSHTLSLSRARSLFVSQDVLSQIPNGMALLQSMVCMDPFEDSSGKGVGERPRGWLTVRNVLSLLA